VASLVGYLGCRCNAKHGTFDFMTDDLEDIPVMNRCERARLTRARALNDAALVERNGAMERRIIFEAGYDHSAFPEDCGGGGHGKHGMGLRFVFSGPKGSVQWVANMFNWYPGNVSHGSVGGTFEASFVPAFQHQHIGDAYAADLGFHSPTPMYEEHTKYECEYLPEGYCYYDGSTLNAEPLLEAFLEHGPHAVWAALARYYNEALAGVER
jgi:hypothetical protein